MKKHNMPRLATDVGITLTDDIKAEYERILQNSSSIDKNNEEECRQLHASLAYLFKMNNI